jgi:hypothetical protein
MVNMKYGLHKLTKDELFKLARVLNIEVSGKVIDMATTITEHLNQMELDRFNARMNASSSSASDVPAGVSSSSSPDVQSVEKLKEFLQDGFQELQQNIIEKMQTSVDEVQQNIIQEFRSTVKPNVKALNVKNYVFSESEDEEAGEEEEAEEEKPEDDPVVEVIDFIDEPERPSGLRMTQFTRNHWISGHVVSCGKVVKSTISKESKVKVMLNKVRYALPDLTVGEVRALQAAIGECFDEFKKMHDEQNFVDLLEKLDSDTIAELIKNTHCKITYTDKYMQNQAKLMFPKLQMLEDGVQTLKNLLLSCYSEFTVQYASNFNTDKGNEAVFSHPAFQKKCEEINNSKMNELIEARAQKLLEERLKSQADATMTG